jgi:hypothetical protein
MKPQLGCWIPVQGGGCGTVLLVCAVLILLTAICSAAGGN